MTLFSRISKWRRKIGHCLGEWFPKRSCVISYDSSLIPEDEAIMLNIALRKEWSPRVQDQCRVIESLYIGCNSKFSSELHRAQRHKSETCGAGAVGEFAFYLSEVEQSEDVEYILSAPRIVLSGLNRDGDTDLFYRPASYPEDEEVFANQRAVLYGEIPWIKLFAVACVSAPFVCCDFYNEKTQKLSHYILQYNSADWKFLPLSVFIRREQAEYFVSFSEQSAFGQNFVMQLKDEEGKEMNERTYVQAML